MPAERSRGQNAGHPTEIPARGWKDILWRVKDEITTDHVSVVAAGVAFFGLLAIFPAVTALISIAGYFLDPADVADQISSLVTVLPENAAAIVQDQILKVTGGSTAATSIAAILGLLFALYGATKGMTTLMEGMNIAYDEEDSRSLVAYYATALALTLFLIAGVLISVGATLVLPTVIGLFGLPPSVETLVGFVKWPLLALLTIFGLAVVYRFGPSRAHAKWRWVSPGALVATVLWLIGTIAFSIYAQNFTDYNETYGTLGGVIILMTWFWLSAFIVLFGAELNAEMEHQTREDTTTGASKPQGRRGAVVADTTPEDLAKSERGATGGARARNRNKQTRRS
jgi:membrane protein